MRLAEVKGSKDGCEKEEGRRWGQPAGGMTIDASRWSWHGDGQDGLPPMGDTVRALRSAVRGGIFRSVNA